MGYTIRSVKGVETFQGPPEDAIFRAIVHSQNLNPAGDVSVETDDGDTIATVILAADWGAPGGIVVEDSNGNQLDVSGIDGERETRFAIREFLRTEV